MWYSPPSVGLKPPSGIIDVMAPACSCTESKTPPVRRSKTRSIPSPPPLHIVGDDRPKLECERSTRQRTPPAAVAGEATPRSLIR